MSPRTAEENRKIAGTSAAAGALLLIAAGVIAVFARPVKVDVVATADVVAVEVVAQPTDVTEQPTAEVVAHPAMTICYHRGTGVVIAALPYGQRWGPGPNREPLATADVDLPPDFSVQDLALRKWEYRDGAMVKVPGVKPAVVIVPPDMEAIE